MADSYIEIGNGGTSNFTGLSDTPASYAGQSGKFVKVNPGETALEFSAGSGSVAWGSVTGTLSSQTDLQTALDAKATTASLSSHTGDATIHFTEASIDHTAITNIGTNTHAQIDTHIASTSNPHSVTAAQVGAQAISTATVSTTDATPTTLVDIAIPTDEEKLLTVKVHGHEDATDDHIWKFMTIGAKNVGGTVSLVGGVDSATGFDAGSSTWTIVASVSTSNVRITVTGEAAHTVDWRAHVQAD